MSKSKNPHMPEDPIIIIGSGLAGYNLAKALRQHDTHVPIVIITASQGDFYSKPLLSTALRYQRQPADLPMADVETMRQTLNATILNHTTVSRIDTQTKHVWTNQQAFTYHKLVLAWGAQPILPPVSGDIDQVVSINDLQSYAHFRLMLADKKRIAILGAGLVGCELANDLIHTGHEVDVIAPCASPVDALLPQEMGQAIQMAFAEQGVRWHLNNSVSRIAQDERQFVLDLQDKKQCQADLVISAVGLKPRLKLAKEAGLCVNRGICVNHYLETSAPDVYALGDCAEVEGLVKQYVAPLMQCARALSKTLAGEVTPVHYPAMPVVLKTPLCPTVVSPPPQKAVCEWQVEGEKGHQKALAFDEGGDLIGFALSGDRVKERAMLTKTLPPMLSITVNE